MKEFVHRGADKSLKKAVAENYPLIGYATLSKLLRKKDIRVNNIRTGTDIILKDGDVVRVFVADQILKCYSIVYADCNIVVVNKRAGVLSDGDGDSTEAALKAEFPTARAVHRLDRNTSGLLVFALNEAAEQELLSAFRHRTVRKLYLATVIGIPKPPTNELTGWLIKDSERSTVHVSASPQSKFAKKIITAFSTLAVNGDGTSLLEVELITGATHQIRAHLAFAGHPVVGDGKYGDSALNKKFRKQMQELKAYKIIFNFSGGLLGYLDKKIISLDNNYLY